MASKKSEHQSKLNITESSDFQYLLELMPVLYKEPSFAWLPELFSIIGYERLVLLCKYCGGERIKVPKLYQLSESLEGLSWYYKVFIANSASVVDVPVEYHKIVNSIAEAINARNNS